MPATLSLAREAFIRHMNRDTVPTERPRLVAVLDAVLDWSAARPDLVQFRADDNQKGVVRFEQVGTRSVFWAATPRRADLPLLELLPGASRLLTTEEKEEAVTRLNSHTRAQNPAGRLHISFGALKNTAARADVLALMSELLEKSGNASPRHADRAAS